MPMSVAVTFALVGIIAFGIALVWRGSSVLKTILLGVGLLFLLIGVITALYSPSVSTTTEQPPSLNTNVPNLPTAFIPSPIPFETMPFSTTIPPPQMPNSSLKCEITAFGSYFPAIQIVQDGLDLQNGFKLELIPGYFPVNGNVVNNYNEEEIYSKLQSGEWDCVFTTLASLSRFGNYGAITVVIDESAGADQVWVRGDITKINDFRGKRIAYSSGSVSEFMIYSLLNLVGLDSTDIIPQPTNSVPDAISLFNSGGADIVSGWEPDILKSEQSGGRSFVTSEQIRYVVDVIVFSQKTIDERPEVVQAFHRAWFQAVKTQFDNFPYSADSIAKWGNNDWTYVYQETAESDLRLWLEHIAQAGYGPNYLLMINPDIIEERLRQSQSIWRTAGYELPVLDVNKAIAPQFVINLIDDASIVSSGSPLNSSFSMAGQPPYPTLAPELGIPIAILPCEKFTFLPDSASLTSESKKLLDECVLPIMKASTFYLHITGSSAWPGKGRYSETHIYNFGKQRALAIAQYLTNNGIDPSRLIIDSVIPPPERREIVEESELEKDRYVRLTLEVSGLR